jgi:putative SOS response-associated peptidase YedK
MCGRYTAHWPLQAFSQEFETPTPLFGPNYNIAPQSDVPIVRLHNGERETAIVRWGLVPGWAKSPEAFQANLFNARSETLAEKPIFKNAVKARRCLIPTSGFYEWQRLGSGSSTSKQPYLIQHTESNPFAFAGLWERWEGGLEFEGRVLETCTILTTEANTLIKPIHERLPVILQRKDYDEWLDPANRTVESVEHLLKPLPGKFLRLYPVSRRVGHVSNNDEKLLNPVALKVESRKVQDEERELVPF